jgi:nitrogen fixation protein FixH
MYISQSSKKALTNPWVLGWLVAVFLVFVINVVFISTAIVTNPGLVEENYYEKGQNHEKNFQTKLATRARLGWKMALRPPQQVLQNQPTNIYFNLQDKSGSQLNVDKVLLTAYRPSDANADIHLTMENIGQGSYLATLNLPLKGLWELQATAYKGEDSFNTILRLDVSDKSRQ